MKIFPFSLQWPYLEFTEFKQSYLPNPVRYFIQIFRIFCTYCILSNDRRPKAEIAKILKSAFTGVRLLPEKYWPNPTDSPAWTSGSVCYSTRKSVWIQERRNTDQ